MSSENVLKKLLAVQPGAEKESALEKFLRPEIKSTRPLKKAPGRPKVLDEKKAKNFTLCLAPQYLQFLDKMVVKDSKVKGRGRKIRFIIERFIEHEKRSLMQVKILKGMLIQVQTHLNTFGGRIKKGEKLDLNTKEKATISQKVDDVHALLRILCYSPKALQKILPREEWAILAFCLDWKSNRGVIL